MFFTALFAFRSAWLSNLCGLFLEFPQLAEGCGYSRRRFFHASLLKTFALWQLGGESFVEKSEVYEPSGGFFQFFRDFFLPFPRRLGLVLAHSLVSGV